MALSATRVKDLKEPGAKQTAGACTPTSATGEQVLGAAQHGRERCG